MKYIWYGIAVKPKILSNKHSFHHHNLLFLFTLVTDKVLKNLDVVTDGLLSFCCGSP